MLLEKRIKACEKLLVDLANDRLTTGEKNLLLKYYLNVVIANDKLEKKREDNA